MISSLLIILENTRDGKIYPPYLRIVYDELRTNDIVPAKEVLKSVMIPKTIDRSLGRRIVQYSILHESLPTR